MSSNTEGTFLLVLLLELIFLASGAAIVKGRGHSVKGVFKGTGTRSRRGYFLEASLGLCLGLVFFLIGQGILGLSRAIGEHFAGGAFIEEASAGSVNLAPPQFSPLGLFGALVGQFLLVGLCEEFFFRGVMYHDLFPRYTKSGGFLSALAFALYHIFPGIVPPSTFALYFGYYFILGLFFAVLTWARNFCLVAPILAHGMFNTVLFLLVYVF